MPHLQFEVTETFDEPDVEPFVERVTNLYAEIMDTGTGHIGVTVRDGASLALGRVSTEDPVAFLNADIRSGRTFEQRRKLAVTVIDELEDRWDIPVENVYVIFTEHPGDDLHLLEGALTPWSAVEAVDEGGSLS